MAKIIYLMGKSASGKDTIYRRLSDMTKLNLKEIVLYTTRPMRPGEQDGVNYHFSDEASLNAFLEQGRVIELREYNTVFGVWKYFSVDDGNIDVSNYNYITIGTLEAYNCYKKYFGSENIFPVYIDVPDGIRLKRAIAREEEGDCPHYDELCRRFLADNEDFSKDKLIAAGIEKSYTNLDIDECVNRIKNDITSQINKDDF